MSRNLRNFKNQVDFFLRSHVPWGRAVRPGDEQLERDRQLSAELLFFLRQFSWGRILRPSPESRFRVLDVGAKNFFFASDADRHFRELGLDPEIHGIEIDAYRRYRNFRTRADYGKFHARNIPRGFYHGINFLDWREPVNVILMLNPFVTPDPLLAWGLPLSLLQPQKIFGHARALLYPSTGFLLISSPTPDEMGESTRLALANGFVLFERHDWHPGTDVIQSQSRYGALFQIG